MADAPAQVHELIEKFDRHAEDYRPGRYNETQVRREYIDPLFCALGWDVYNRAGYAEAYKDVIHEDAIKVGGTTEAPDYCFRVGGQRKFFVEAKKPSIDIARDVSPAYQLRRYAWSAKLPLSILTDFEELAVYDCRVRPRPAIRDNHTTWAAESKIRRGGAQSPLRKTRAGTGYGATGYGRFPLDARPPFGYRTADGAGTVPTGAHG